MNQLPTFKELEDIAVYQGNLLVRGDLILQITSFINASNLSPAKIEQLYGLSQSRIKDLLDGQVLNFTIDELVNIALLFNLQIYIELKKN